MAVALAQALNDLSEHKHIHVGVGAMQQGGHLLGHGAFGIVFQPLVNNELDTSVVVKQVRIPDDSDDENFHYVVDEIITFLHTKSCPFIVKMHDAWIWPEMRVIEIKMEHAGRDLMTIKEEFGPLSGIQTQDMVFSVASALAFLHERCIMHTDVKDDNIFKGVLWKLGDLGLARPILETNKGEVQAKKFRAPEVWEKQNYNEKIDVWSLYIVATGALAKNAPTPKPLTTAIKLMGMRDPTQRESAKKIVELLQ